MWGSHSPNPPIMRWIALLLLVFIIAGAAIFFRPEPTDTGAAPAPEREPAVAAAPDAAEPQGALPQASRPAATPSGVAAATAPETASGTPEEPPTEPQQETRVVLLQQKYGNLPRSELLATLAELDLRVQEEQRTLLEQRFQRGIYEVSLLGDPPLPLLEPGPDGLPPVSDNRAMTDPGSGQTENQRTYLPFDEYAEFYELKAEAAWLRQFANQ